MLTRRQQQMVDLHDNGKSYDQIAAIMGVKRDSVTRTFSMLRSDLSADKAHATAMRLGSEALARAIMRAPRQRQESAR